MQIARPDRQSTRRSYRSDW